MPPQPNSHLISPSPLSCTVMLHGTQELQLSKQFRQLQDIVQILYPPYTKHLPTPMKLHQQRICTISCSCLNCFDNWSSCVVFYLRVHCPTQLLQLTLWLNVCLSRFVVRQQIRTLVHTNLTTHSHTCTVHNM